MSAVYLTIWCALLLFAVGEVGRSSRPTDRGARGAWWAFTLGLILAVLHTALAFGVAHGWSHEAAVISTARQTAAVYGVPFGAGIYVNYLFLGVWAVDAWWWRTARSHRRARVTWTLRAFYMLIILNAAVVFASPWRRVLGLTIVGALAATWLADLRRTRSRAPAVGAGRQHEPAG